MGNFRMNNSGKWFYKKHTNQKEIALTFDDGLDAVFTPKIIKILNEYNIKATFFLLGINIDRNPEIVEELIKQKHEIGNHSYSHKTLIFKSPRYIQNEIEKTDLLLAEFGLEKTQIFRPPFGRYFISLLFVLWKMKKKMVLWNIGPKDFKAKNSKEIISKIEKMIIPGSIIVLHEKSGEKTLEALKILIPKLLKENYEFKKISDLFGFSNSNL